MESRRSFESFEGFKSFIMESYSEYDEDISMELMGCILVEIEESEGLVELASSQSFENFWDQVDVQNAYEDEWGSWKSKGIERAYSYIWNEFKNSNFSNDIFI